MRHIVCFALCLVGCYNIDVFPRENAPPRVQGEQLTGTEDTTKIIESAELLANDQDPDGDPNNLALTVELVEGSAINGVAIQDEAQIIFTPAPNFAGVASFSYIVLDEKQSPSAPATVNIDFASVEDFPVALTPATILAQEDTPITITLQATDVDGGDLTFLIINEPNNGSTSQLNDQQTSATLVYTPNLNFNGDDFLRFQVRDPGTPGLLSGVVTVSIIVAPQNDAPTANADIAPTTVQRGGNSVEIPVIDNDVDPEGNLLTPEIIIPPLQGTAIVSGENIVYTSNNIFVGDVIFFYAAKDASASSVPVQVTVTVVSACGDGVVDSTERCDDKNNIDLDGCEADCTFTCANSNDPDSAAVFGGSCYAVFREVSNDFKANWNNAQAFCAINNADLVIIDNLAENEHLRDTVLVATDTPWIGGTDQQIEENLNDTQIGDQFVWSDGSSFPSVGFFNFSTGQPNNSNGNEDCLFMLEDGTWDDTNCTNPLDGGLLLVNTMICEFPIP
jgi:cysteine-rich repeat protein